MNRSRPLTSLIEDLRASLDGDRVSVGHLVDNLGASSFPIAILAVALLLITPVSGIPTVPTFGATIVVLAAAQWLLHRRGFWLPRRIARLELPARRVRAGLAWLDRPAAFVDRIVKPRLVALTRPPFAQVVVLTVILVALPWPVVELLPFVSSIGGLIVACLVFGLMVRDGLFVLLGYGLIAGIAAAVAWAL